MIEEIKSALLPLGIHLEGTRLPKEILCVVPVSGGKDSQVCYKMACETFGAEHVLGLFCDTKYEHPLTYKHVRDIEYMYGGTILTITAGSVLEKCLKYKRFPGGGARHCTDELKLRPSKFFYKELASRIGGYEVWCGVRSDESPEREKRYRGKVSEDLYAPHEFMPRKYPKYLEKMGVMFRLPVLDWSKSEIINTLATEINPLYKHGFDRVGCFPCLASGEKHKVNAFNFDETGRRHFKIAQEISGVAGRPVFVTNKYQGLNESPGCALCAM